MYAQHAGTRKWQKIINHDSQNKKSNDITKAPSDYNNYIYNVFSPTVNTSLLNQSSLWQQQVLCFMQMVAVFCLLIVTTLMLAFCSICLFVTR